MNYPELTGAVGVFLLLLAFFFNLFNFVSKNSKLYLAFNITGAALACYASVLINYFPFVILEGAWSMIALLAFLRVVK